MGEDVWDCFETLGESLWELREQIDPPPAPDCSCFLQSQFTVTLDSLLALVKDMAGAGGDGVLVKDNNIAVGKTTLWAHL